MGLFDKKPKAKVIEQRTFILETDKLIADAKNPKTSVSASLEAGRTVLKRLADIDGRAVVIQPPLSNEQFTAYEERAELIVALGEKGLQSQNEATAARSTAVANQPASEPAYHGSGSAVKR